MLDVLPEKKNPRPISYVLHRLMQMMTCSDERSALDAHPLHAAGGSKGDDATSHAEVLIEQKHISLAM